jgi:prepilin-type N-terminal cleavage/methylation domain-containing protein
MTASPGFTLVELSIVLVIIGLILGGVMVGRSMIRSTQVNRVASDLESYAAAAQMFVDKYQGLPGDMTNATTYWSSTIVANGDGDGQLDAAGAASTAGETFGAWEQMALAGMLKGTFNGIAGAGGVNNAVPGTNAPKGPLSGTAYAWAYYGTLSGGPNLYDGYYGNSLHFGTALTTTVPSTFALTPSEAYAIDLKIDDGIPGTGNLLSYHTSTGCNTGNTAATGASSVYLATSSAIACFFVYKTGL